MKELWLKFTDSDGRERRVEVDKARFVIGRHSEADLCIPDGRLSREHVRIERLGDKFLISDLGSSNGSALNGDALSEKIELKDGDEITLGGSVSLSAEIPGDPGTAPDPEIPAASAETPPDAAAGGPGGAAPAFSASAGGAAPPRQSSSVPASVFFIAPALGLLILALIGGLIYFLGSSKQPVVASGDDFQYSKTGEDGDLPVNKRNTKSDGDSETATSSPGLSVKVSGPTPANPDSTANQPPPLNLSDTARIEQNAAAFLRRVAQNDPKAFLTTEQAKRLSSKVRQFSNSQALADNINSARKNAVQIRSLATAKNLKPQFLAVAALAKLGNSRGDVLKTAAGMADVLDKLSIQVNNESGEDALLMIAAYDQGASGDFLKMRNMLQDLANKFPESARAIRSVWFLEKNGRITSSEFDAALTFLAVGTITQNPKDFGVNAETLSL